MKLLLLFAFALTPSVFAAGIAPSAPCVAGSLASYIALGGGGCTQVTDTTLVLFDFGFNKSPGAPLNPLDVTVTPTVSGSTASLQFNADFNANTNQTHFYLIRYTIDPPPVIHGFYLEMDTLTPAGGGRAFVTTELCIGAAFATPNGNSCPTVSATLDTFYDSSSSPDSFDLADALGFAGVGIIGVRTSVLLEANAGSSQIDGFTAGAATVPEPATVVLLAAGLGILLLLRRR